MTRNHSLAGRSLGGKYYFRETELDGGREDTKSSTALHWAARCDGMQAAQGLATLRQTLQIVGSTLGQGRPGDLSRSACWWWLAALPGLVLVNLNLRRSSYKNPQTQAPGGPESASKIVIREFSLGGSPVESFPRSLSSRVPKIMFIILFFKLPIIVEHVQLETVWLYNVHVDSRWFLNLSKISILNQPLPTQINKYERFGG